MSTGHYARLVNSGHFPRPETQRSGPYMQSEQGHVGYCYVCGRWSRSLRYKCVHTDRDMLLCWICQDCDVLP